MQCCAATGNFLLNGEYKKGSDGSDPQYCTQLRLSYPSYLPSPKPLYFQVFVIRKRFHHSPIAEGGFPMKVRDTIVLPNYS